MNREDITRLAQEAGFVGMDGDHGALRRFATLVASAEREACAKLCDVIAQKMDDEGEGPTGNIGWVIDCAEAIRARGQA